MEKGRLFAAALSFVSVTGVVVACSDSTGSTFPGEQPDGGDSDGNVTPFNPDSGKTTDGPTGSVTCIPDTPQTFQAKWNPPTAATVCKQAQLDEYYDKCLVGAIKG